MLFLLIMKMRCVFCVFDTWIKVGPATEPPSVRRPEHTCVHVHSRGMRVLHMCNKADARRPEPWIIFHPRDTFARGHRILRTFAQGAVDSRDVDPNLFEHTATAHDTHQPAACI